jgi:hypothetical protein
MSYVALATTTLSSATSSVTFGSIPATYKDLVIQISYFSAGSPVRATAVLNGDTGNNYSLVFMDGNPDNSTASGSQTRANFSFAFSSAAASSTRPYSSMLTIFDYSAVDKHKTALLRGGNAADRSSAYAQRWANTAAITSVAINSAEGGNFLAGSTISLYGIA